ncbi:MAG: hypothetical protein K2K80_01920, partial [Clostridia bacterium]|nr:hypothetical protein [Clostridia bacterium]
MSEIFSFFYLLFLPFPKSIQICRDRSLRSACIFGCRPSPAEGCGLRVSSRCRLVSQILSFPFIAA